MGGVFGFDAGRRGESQCEQRVACSDLGRRIGATDPERARLVTGVVARWKDDRVFVVAKRNFASVSAIDGGRRGGTVHEDFDGRGHREMVAGW